MKQLMLVRHAKSSWEVPLPDRDRPLLNRGITDANLMSATLEDQMPKNYFMWSSTAKRARDTARIFAQNFSYPEESIHLEEALYTFDVNQLEKTVKSCEDRFDNVILFGHNDAITNFVNKFGDLYIENVATCGVVSLAFHAQKWSEIANGKIKVAIFPRDLR